MKKFFSIGGNDNANRRSSQRDAPGAHITLLDSHDKQYSNSMMTTHALEFVAEHLSDTQKRGFAGLCACLLPEAHDGSTDLEWSKRFLALLVEHFLSLPQTQVDAYLPMLAMQHDAVQERTDKQLAAAAVKSSTATTSNSTVHESAVLDVAPFVEVLVPETPAAAAAAASGLRSFFKRTPKDEKPTAADPSPSSSSSSSASTSTSAPTATASQTFRRTLLQQQLWFTVKSIGYDSRARVLLRHLAAALAIDWRLVTLEEVRIGRALYAEATAMPLEKQAAAPSVWDWKRNATIGAAAITGGALLALTGGMAAPAIATGLTALGAGAAVTTAVVSTAGVTATSILFGAAGAGVVGTKTDARLRGVHEFNFDLVSSGDGMNVYICISGWLDDDDDPVGASGFRRSWGDSREYLRAFYRQHKPEKTAHVDQVMDRYKGREDEFFAILQQTYNLAPPAETSSDPLQMLAASRAASVATGAAVTAHTPEAMRAWRWRDRFHQGDQYVLQWEEHLLRRFGSSMRSFARQQVAAYANAEIVKHTALALLATAVAIPRAILKLADMIDNVWVLTMNAADASGKLLAASLLRREQGLRPVTLVGYGMGARLVFACLQELAKEPDASCGIVENAVLLGTPAPADCTDWTNARRVVAGRLINGYSENDWMLGVMYRYQGWALHSAGIAAIQVAGIENVDLSSIIGGHLEYKNKIGVIMDRLNIDS